MKRIVIKIGSNIIAGSEEGLDMSVISRIAKDISRITAEGNEVAIVSSGAVAAGMK